MGSHIINVADGLLVHFKTDLLSWGTTSISFARVLTISREDDLWRWLPVNEPHLENHTSSSQEWGSIVASSPVNH